MILSSTVLILRNFYAFILRVCESLRGWLKSSPCALLDNLTRAFLFTNLFTFVVLNTIAGQNLDFIVPIYVDLFRLNVAHNRYFDAVVAKHCQKHDGYGHAS